jgi:hypothetical protein
MANGSLPSQAEWASILAAVKRPIGLLALFLLVSATAVVAVASSQPQVLFIAVLFFAFVGLVVICVLVWRPAALGIERPRDLPVADSLAEAVVAGLEGSVTNLPSEEQIGAWVDLILRIEWHQQGEGTPEQEFRASLVRGIQFRVLRKSPHLKAGIEARLKEGRVMSG